MTSPFDPRHWLPQRPPGAAGARSFLDSWAGLTAWTFDPLTAVTKSLPYQPEVMLTQLIEGLVAAFTGRRFELEAQGKAISGSLGSLRLVRRKGRNQVVVDVTDVDVDGVRLDQISVVAGSVRIQPGLEPVFEASDIEVGGSLPATAAVGWVDRHVPGWSLRLDDAGNLLGRRQGYQPEFVLAVEVTDDVAHLEVRGVRWRSRELSIPSWLRIERRFPLNLTAGWSIVAASRSKGEVRFRMLGQTFDQRLDAKQLRDAILRGGGLRF